MIAFRAVRAAAAKAQAEPVAALYEQGGSTMCNGLPHAGGTDVPDDRPALSAGGQSRNQVDALVWALQMLDPGSGGEFRRPRIREL